MIGVESALKMSNAIKKQFEKEGTRRGWSRSEQKRITRQIVANAEVIKNEMRMLRSPSGVTLPADHLSCVKDMRMNKESKPTAAIASPLCNTLELFRCCVAREMLVPYDTAADFT
eukprot:3809164-Pleurochrysis_carterae.AAC.1